jgi:hypothetical protein
MKAAQPPFERGRAAVAALVGGGSHLLAFLLSFLATRLTSNAEGLRDIGNGVLTFFGVEIVAGLVFMIGGSLLYTRGRREIGLGLTVGWLLGLLITVLYLSVVVD